MADRVFIRTGDRSGSWNRWWAYGAGRGMDREGVHLRIDEDGVYVGGSRPVRLPWSGLAEVMLFRHTTYGSRDVDPTPASEKSVYYATFVPGDPGHPATPYLHHPFDAGATAYGLHESDHREILILVRRHSPLTRVVFLGHVNCTSGSTRLGLAVKRWRETRRLAARRAAAGRSGKR